MKNLILTMIFVFALSSISNANSEIKKEGINFTTEIAVAKDCWAAADEAEAAFCGYVGCSYDYWVGYMDSCMGENQ